MQIKLIVSDVDGTLIDVSEQPSDAFYRLAALLREHACNITLASGRCYDQIAPFVQKLNITLPVVINNGGGCVLDGKLLWNNVIDYRYIKDAILKADALDMAIVTSDWYTDKAYRHNAYIQNQIDKFGRFSQILRPTLDHEWEALNVQKLLIIDPQRPGRIDEVLPYFEPYRDVLNIVRYDDRSADIMLKVSNKAAGVARVAAMLDIPTEQIMAIGDAKNDMEMLALVGMGVAVSNADAQLKAIANHVCSAPYASGVQEAVETFYLHQSVCNDKRDF